MSWGRRSRAEAIKALRDYAENIKAEAENILSCPDDDLIVKVVRGVHVQKLVEILKP